jgi:hypothetical protein
MRWGQPLADNRACAGSGFLSGIISAILLGLGRVIGETMVDSAGNRIAIPDFTQGLGAFSADYTMAGIIAQEMGEVVRGSICYAPSSWWASCFIADTRDQLWRSSWSYSRMSIG